MVGSFFMTIKNYDQADEVISGFFKDPLFTEGVFHFGLFNAQIPLVDGAVEAIRQLSQKFDIYIVTSRHLVLIHQNDNVQCIEDITRKWIDRHFHGLIKDIYIGNLWNANGRKM